MKINSHNGLYLFCIIIRVIIIPPEQHEFGMLILYIFTKHAGIHINRFDLLVNFKPINVVILNYNHSSGAIYTR